MIRIENVEVAGWEAAIRGARNPMNSWQRSDSYWTRIADDETMETAKYEFFVGENDLKLLKDLRNAGSDHGKFMRMINVSMDITAPLYWWKEFDTYKVGTVANSCSTMHKIHDKEFTIADFSCEKLFDECIDFSGDGEWSDYLDNDEEFRKFYCIQDTYCGGLQFREVMEAVIGALNNARYMYHKAKTKPMKDNAKRVELMKRYWWQMIQLLPSSYNQKRTVQLNYEVLRNMYHARKNHKLNEWSDFCVIVKTLPYAAELIVGVVE